MDVQFRPAAIEDLSELCSFSRYIFSESFKDTCSPEDMNTFLADKYSFDRIRSELSDPASSFFLLFTDGTLAGYIKMNEAPAQTDIHDVDALELERIYVSKAIQKKASVHT